MKLDLCLGPAADRGSGAPLGTSPRPRDRAPDSPPASAHPLPRGTPVAVVAGAVPVLRSVVPLERDAAPVAIRAPADEWFEADFPPDGVLWIPVGAHVTGDCRAEHVHVAGRVDGHVQASGGTLVVSAGAVVHGSVEGRGRVVVAGKVVAAGRQRAVISHGHLSLACTARVTGPVEFREVDVYSGARVDGPLVRR